MNDFRTKLCFFLSVLLFSSIIFAQDVKIPSSGIYAFTSVNVVPMDEEQVLENQTVVVTDGKITDIGPSGETEVPAAAEKIDGSGRYLMPGLAEMHGHIPGGDQPDYAERVLFLYIANGVTTVRNMLGNPYNLELRERVKNNEIHGPTIFAASPWLNNDNVPSPDAAERVVREHKATGYDLLKIGGLSPERYEQLALTAHEIGMPFGGHVSEEVGLKGALEAGQTSIDHYDRYVEFLVPEDINTKNRSNGFFGSGLIDVIDRDRISEAVKLTVESDTWNVPTLSLVEHLASEEAAEVMISRPEMQYMPREVLNGWLQAKKDFGQRDDFQPEAAAALVELRRELTRRLYDAGAPIALGSDAPQFFNVPGFSIHHELQMMVASGLSPYEVLVTGTRNPAEYFGTPEAFGTVETGRRADLILLNENPLQDISNVQDRAGVMVRGMWYPEEVIQEGLSDIAAGVKGE